jgi:hypothetical protein
VILEGLPSPEKGAGGGEGENKRKNHLIIIFDFKKIIHEYKRLIKTIAHCMVLAKFG